MSFTVQGWCPGALRPMESGDGLVVRIRVPGGRLSPEQARGIARAARTHGNGLIDLSGRANLPLRGVREASRAPLIADLAALGLIDPDLGAETRRNVIVTPFADAHTDALAAALAAVLPQMPELPGKFGFMLDCGPAPVMAQTPADIRVERAVEGQLILRAAGLELGAPIHADDLPEAACEMAHWFVAAGGIRWGRMVQLVASGARPEGRLAPCLAPAPALAAPGPGLVAEGALVGFEFGQMAAETLAALAELGALRLTPWRMLLIEGAQAMPDLPGLVTDPADPILRVFACTGAPGCLQAARPTRPLARALARCVPPGRVLHVSGCAKGCGWPARADLTLTATPAGFDLIVAGTAADEPLRTALSEAEAADLVEFYYAL